MENSLFVTGFGAFSGVEDNPSKHIVQELKNSGFCCGNFQQIHFSILEVSVEHCSQIHAKFAETGGQNSVFVHIGVDSKAKSVKLEQCAYNNMTFRVPDVCGYQPQDVKICSESTLDCPIYTELPLSKICEDLNVTYPDGSISTGGDDDAADKVSLVQLSQDPGRYLCNYTYYQALQHQKSAGRPIYALFVHVPPFDVIPQERQVALVRSLLERIASFVCDQY